MPGFVFFLIFARKKGRKKKEKQIAAALANILASFSNVTNLPIVSFLDIYPKEMKTEIHTHTHNHLFVTM